MSGFHLQRLVFDQRPPVQPVSESRGGTQRVVDRQRADKQKSLCLILDKSVTSNTRINPKHFSGICHLKLQIGGNIKKC